MKVVNVKYNSDGYKEEGMGHPSSKSQQQLFKEVHREANVEPSKVIYIEAHGTGSNLTAKALRTFIKLV